jgi:transcriptional regulator with XRE-family HTH domain
MGERPIKMNKSWVLGARLLASRQLAGLSQKKAAAELGVTATTLGNYESGDTEPPLAALISLARVYGNSLALLLKGIESDPDQTYVHDYEAVRVGYRIQYLRGGRAQSWLARQAGFAHEEIRSFEAGETTPPKEYIQKLADALEVTAIDITGKKPVTKNRITKYASSQLNDELAQFPPMIGEIEQDDVCIATEHLLLMNVEKPRVMLAPRNTRLLPYWGILAGDCLIVDSSISSYNTDSVYLLEIENELVLRALLKRGRELWLEPLLGGSDPEPLPPGAKITGQVVWRSGILLETPRWGEVQLNFDVRHKQLIASGNE